MAIDVEKKWIRRSLVILSALSFLLLTTAIITVHGSPVTGYEYSVYRSTPMIFWIAIILCLMTGMLVFHAHYGTGRRMWVVGLFEILLSNFVLVTLYLYRGFMFLERGDSLSYVGYAKDIVQLGHIPSYNFYPAISLSMVSVGDILGHGMILVSQLLPAIFLIAYTIGILCWSRTISSQARFVTSMVFASLPILFAWFIPTLYHETLCVLMLPFFFFILWRSLGGDARFKLLAAVMIVFFVAGHPFVAIGVLVFLFIILVVEHLAGRHPRMISPYFGLFAFVILFGWIVIHSQMAEEIKYTIGQVLGQIEGASTMGEAWGQASQAGLLSTIRSILVCTIDDIIFLLLALWMGALVLKGGWRAHPMTRMLACLLGGSVFLIAIMFLAYAHTPIRLINLNFIMIFTIPMVGYLLCSKRARRNAFKTYLITGLILFCLVSTVFTVYLDPNEGFPNSSVTSSEVTGMSWFLDDMDDRVGLYSLQTGPNRYAELIFGTGYLRDHDLYNYTIPTTAHFQSFLEANSTVGTDYLIYSTYDVIAYTKTWAAVGKFNENDFKNLTASTSVNRIYENDGLYIYSRTMQAN